MAEWRWLENLMRKVSYGADEPGRVSGRARPPRHPRPVEAVYAAEYPKLVRLLVVMGATMEEAQDAAQEAMMDFFSRSRAWRGLQQPGRLCVPGGDPVFRQVPPA